MDRNVSSVGVLHTRILQAELDNFKYVGIWRASARRWGKFKRRVVLFRTRTEQRAERNAWSVVNISGNTAPWRGKL
jgi:hypothetical protein